MAETRHAEPTVDDLQRVLWGLDSPLTSAVRRYSVLRGPVESLRTATAAVFGEDWRTLTRQTSMGRYRFRHRVSQIDPDTIAEWAALIGPARRALIAAYSAGLDAAHRRETAELEMLRTRFAVDLWTYDTIGRIVATAKEFAIAGAAMAGRTVNEVATVAGRAVGSFFGASGIGTIAIVGVAVAALVLLKR